MIKKVLALALVLALAMGTLAMSAAAETTSSTDYKVGYAKVDLNPYWHEWVKWSTGKKITNANYGTVGDPLPWAGKLHEAYSDPYDLLPLPMGGYGNNDTRLSRPKLMDDNGSGVGVGTVNRTATTSDYYKNSSGKLVRATAGSTYGALFDADGKLVEDYQDVHLEDNRYTKDFATKLFGGDQTKIQAYMDKAGIKTDDDWGDNDGDGVWATCVYIEDPQSAAPMLIFSVDNIGVPDSLTYYDGSGMDLILNEMAGTGVTEDQIIINANHTHGSISLGSIYNQADEGETYYLAENYFGDDISFQWQEVYQFLRFYKNFLFRQLAAAARAAYEERETALTMEKGAIDASEQTGYQLNGVRHNVQTFTSSAGKGSITYVRGSSFNNDVNGDGTTDSHSAKTISTGTSTYRGTFTKSRPVTESNDKMQILKFTFENKEPIAMVNFRAHSTANNKEAPKMLHYNISADWVSPLRYDMENAKTLGFDNTDYRFSLLYGNSGNLGTGLSNGDGNPIISSYANYVKDRDGVSRWQLPATPYGRQIAQAALALLKTDASEGAILEKMHEVTMGPIVSARRTFVVQKQQWTDLQYAAALKYRNNSSYVSGNKTVEITVNDGETVTNGSNSIKVATGGTYTIASKYHANHVVAIYTEESTTKELELNAFRLGNAVAFSTSSVEASDRYISGYTGSTSNIPQDVVNAINDWEKLVNASWGTPFDLSLTNGSDGYIPNSLAYDYNGDVTNTNYTMAIGSYESHSAFGQRGTGELMVQELSEMMESIAPVQMAQCRACGREVEWLPLTASAYNNIANIENGHYFLDGNFDATAGATVPEGVKLCLDLNGDTLTAPERAFLVYGILNIQDSGTGGTVRGTAVDGKDGGTVYVANGGVVNQHGGTLTCNQVENVKIDNGGVVYVNKEGAYTLHNGTITGGVTSGSGGNVYNLGTFIMKAGTISDGTIDNDEMTAYTMGGNVYTTGTFTMESGSITGGEVEPKDSDALGGNVHVQGGTFTMQGGSITGGNAYTGDNVCTNNSTFRLEGGYIGDGIYIQSKLVLASTTDGNTPVNITLRKIADNLTIEGSYTGKVKLRSHEGTAGFTVGTKIGTADNADISGAQITLDGVGDLRIAVVGSELQLTAPTGSVASVGNVYYDTVAAAINAYKKATEPVVLLAEQALGTLTKDVCVDLNGYNVTAVNTGSYKLTVLDSATDDFVGATYGTVPAGVGVVAAPGYLAVTEGDKTSFHKYEMELDNLIVNPIERGITYATSFKGDQKVKEQVKEFGIAMRAYNAPNEMSIWSDPECKTHVAHPQSQWQTGDGTDAVKSVYVSNIIDPDIEDDVNQARANVLIYGRAYIQLEDGTMLFSEAADFSMRSAMEHVDLWWNEGVLSTGKKEKILAFYLDEEYHSFMQSWTLPNIQADAGEDNGLTVGGN